MAPPLIPIGEAGWREVPVERASGFIGIHGLDGSDAYVWTSPCGTERIVLYEHASIERFRARILQHYERRGNNYGVWFDRAGAIWVKPVEQSIEFSEQVPTIAEVIALGLFAAKVDASKAIETTGDHMQAAASAMLWEAAVDLMAYRADRAALLQLPMHKAGEVLDRYMQTFQRVSTGGSAALADIVLGKRKIQV